MNNIKTIAGMSLGGGKKENFFFCILEYFPTKQRWFLTSLKQVKEEVNLTQDEAITTWVEGSSLKKLVVDFPLNEPACATCSLKCPGTERCHNPIVVKVRNEMHALLEEDNKRSLENPKRYEQQRNDDDLIDHGKSVLSKETHHHILSKSFKRKLRKGFVPYWNRPVDFWIWRNFYDQLLKSFNISYDSFGNVSVMLLHKFRYLLKHLPIDLGIYESNVHIALIELYRAGIVNKKILSELQDIDLCTLSRVRIIKKIEESLGIFIYQKDLEILSKNSRAFDSFILAVCGQALMENKIREIPSNNQKTEKFIVPNFC